jgi:hypothetical protein
MPEQFGSINTSIFIPTFHSAVIRIPGIGIEFGEEGLKEFCNVQVIANRR